MQNAKDRLQNIGLTNPLKALRSKARGRGGIGRRKGLKIRCNILFLLAFILKTCYKFQAKTDRTKRDLQNISAGEIG